MNFEIFYERCEIISGIACGGSEGAGYGTDPQF